MHPLFQVEEEYRLTLLDAESSFVERFIGRITDPGTGWGPLWAQFHDQPASITQTAGINERQEP